MSLVVKDIKEFFGEVPETFLVAKLPIIQSYHIKQKGDPYRALDLGMGEGRNAVYLAKQEYEVEGVDISSNAVQKAVSFSQSQGVQINGIVADLKPWVIRPNHYDLIICFYFLERALFSKIVQGLRRGGAVLYQSVTTDELLINPSFPREWCLERNELLHAFRDLRILFYEETVLEGKMSHAAIASLLAIKP